MERSRFLSTQESSLNQIMESLSIEESLKMPLYAKEETQIDLKKIVKVIESLFSDKMLYQNKKLKHMVLNSRNGWVKIDLILQLKEVQNTFKQVELVQMIDRKLLARFIKTELQLYPSTLKVNKNYIRRKVPFVNKISKIKPIYVHSYNEEHQMRTISEDLASIAEIYKVKFKVGETWCLVYAAEPQKIMQISEQTKRRRLQKHDWQQQNVHTHQQEGFQFQAINYEGYLPMNYAIENFTKNSIESSALQPLVQSYMNQKMQPIRMQMLNSLFHKSPFSHLKHKQLRQEIQSMEQERNDTQTFRKGRTFGMRNELKLIHGFGNRSTEAKIDQQTHQVMKQFMRFYQPNLQMNAKAFSNFINKTENQKSVVAKDKIITEEQEKIINEALGQNMLLS